MQKLFLYSFFIPVVLSVVISIFFIPYLSNNNYILKYNESSIYFTKYLWPSPSSTKITSYFGYRNAPTSGASSYHGGIDIGAREGSNIVAIANGTVKYVGWYGANGYSVLISHENGIVSTYSHISNNFLVSVGDDVLKGDIIANVGPKYIAGPPNNPYHDSSGRSTNGATTGPHLHFGLSINGKKVDPLQYVSPR